MDEISTFNSGLGNPAKATCETIRSLFDSELKESTSKLFHGAPVWFLDGNPVVGYSMKKAGIAILFWSGQGFREPGLHPIGKYKAAELLVSADSPLPLELLKKWLTESKHIMWDYKNIAKNQGILEKL